jgi:SAM-dependent methyltransferase
MRGTYKWPKQRPVLSEEQLKLMHSWYEYWLPIVNNSFGLVSKFNHRFPFRSASRSLKTLEIGIGEGSHLRLEQSENYFGVDRDVALIRHHTNIAAADADIGLPFRTSSFDRVLAIHVLEHLANLPSALQEIRRIMKPGGLFSAVVPCEGGWAYTLGRNLTSRRIFERKFGKKFDWMMAYDHVNNVQEVLTEIRKKFCVERIAYFPMRLPSVHMNLIIGLELRPLQTHEDE